MLHLNFVLNDVDGPKILDENCDGKRILGKRLTIKFTLRSLILHRTVDEIAATLEPQVPFPRGGWDSYYRGVRSKE